MLGLNCNFYKRNLRDSVWPLSWRIVITNNDLASGCPLLVLDKALSCYFTDASCKEGGDSGFRSGVSMAGLPAPSAVSVSVVLTPNLPFHWKVWKFFVTSKYVHVLFITGHFR